MASKVDPCTVLAASLSSNRTATWSAANECLSTFPLSLDHAKDTIQSLNKTLDMYFYQKWAAHPPSTLPGQPAIQIKTILDPISRDLTSLPNQLAFQRRLMRTFIPVNDGHLTYAPTCFQQLSYTQPFSLVAHTTSQAHDASTPHVIITIQAISRSVSQEHQRYKGAQVLRIHEKPAVAYLQHWADKWIGGYKDPVTRLQQTMSSVRYNGTSWSTLPGSYTRRTFPPSTPSVTWTLRLLDGSIIEVNMPWIVSPLKALPSGSSLPFNSTSTYWRAYCEPEKPFSHERGNVDDDYDCHAVGVSLRKRSPAHPSHDPILSFRISGDPALDIPKPIQSTLGMSLYLLDQNGHPVDPSSGADTNEVSTAVLIIPTFGFFDEMANQWRRDVASILATMSRHPIRHLILDVQGNNGGNGCLASELIATLFPDPKVPFPDTSFPIPKKALISPFFTSLTHESYRGNVTKSSFHPSHYLSPLKLYPLTESQILHPVQQMNAIPYPYTQELVDTCPTTEDNPLASLDLTLPPPGNMTILSEGACSSACGRLTHHLRKVQGVPGVVIGLPGHQSLGRLISGYPASQVYTLEELLIDQDLVHSHSHLPAPLPIQANFRFTLRGSFPVHGQGMRANESDLPLEYQWDPVEYIIPWTESMVNRPDRMWARVARLLQG